MSAGSVLAGTGPDNRIKPEENKQRSAPENFRNNLENLKLPELLKEKTANPPESIKNNTDDSKSSDRQDQKNELVSPIPPDETLENNDIGKQVSKDESQDEGVAVTTANKQPQPPAQKTPSQEKNEPQNVAQAPLPQMRDNAPQVTSPSSDDTNSSPQQIQQVAAVSDILPESNGVEPPRQDLFSSKKEYYLSYRFSDVATRQLFVVAGFLILNGILFIRPRFIWNRFFTIDYLQKRTTTALNPLWLLRSAFRSMKVFLFGREQENVLVHPLRI